LLLLLLGLVGCVVLALLLRVGNPGTGLLLVPDLLLIPELLLLVELQLLLVPDLLLVPELLLLVELQLLLAPELLLVPELLLLVELQPLLFSDEIGDLVDLLVALDEPLDGIREHTGGAGPGRGSGNGDGTQEDLAKDG
jgi:hypothetical protein